MSSTTRSPLPGFQSGDAPVAKWRNLGVFGMLDETRHTQLDLRFSHDLLRHDVRFDWAQKAFHTNEWGVLAVKNFFDDIMLSADCVEAALATSLTVEHGFTNIQFVALAADAMAAGDINWSNLLSSIQTDEAPRRQRPCLSRLLPAPGLPLVDGSLDGSRLTCAAHGWEFDLRTGEGVNPRAVRLTRHAVRTVDGVLLVSRLPACGTGGIQ